MNIMISIGEKFIAQSSFNDFGATGTELSHQLARWNGAWLFRAMAVGLASLYYFYGRWEKRRKTMQGN